MLFGHKLMFTGWFGKNKNKEKETLKKRVNKPRPAGKLQSSRHSVKTPVSQLQVGMYISRLDKPWLETPFLVQGFYVSSDDELTEVTKYCEYVYVDTLRQKWVAPKQAGKRVRAPGQVKYSDAKATQVELAAASKTYSNASKITKGVLDQVRLGGGIDVKKVKETVAECVDGILQNADALLWLTRMEESSFGLENHSLSVCILGVSFGRYLGLGREELVSLGMAGLLHDVGIMQLAEQLADKAHSKSDITDAELKGIKEHAGFGRNIMMGQGTLPPSVVDVAYSHHEKFDGSGYPRGLKGSAIPRYAMIVSIVETYDVLTNSSSFNQTSSSLEALKVIYQGKNSQFEPELAQAFIRCIGLYPPGSIVELQNGSIAVVMDRNYRHKHLPKVLVVRDNELKVINPMVIDLEKVHSKPKGSNFLIKKVHPENSFGVTIEELTDNGLLNKTG
jgi:HD-GYP domain-containing protein (c-di-GMP phosphodiesterase class II)